MRAYRLLSGLVLAGFLSCFLFCSSAYAQTTGVRLSFVQTANTAKLVSVPGQPNQYTLTLYNVKPYITYYFDRPSRTVGLATIAGFVAAWGVGNNSFAANNPNAVIYAGQVNGESNLGESAYVIQIASPHYDKANNQMTYSVTPLNKEGFVLDELDLANAVLIIN